jgi:hypothetical protein
MNFLNMRRFSLAKFIGRFGTIAVDTFSTLIFFAMQGRSWVLITTGLIFAFVKVWHWQRSFNSPDELKRRLHRVAWCVMAALSVYFLITLGVTITEPETEQTVVVDETAAVLAKAVAESKAARINALVQEQTMLLNQNASLTERLASFGQWSNAAADFRATIDSNNERLGKIGAELTALYEQQAAEAARETEAKKETQKEKDNLVLTSIRNFKPIGAPALLERVMPQRFTGFAIRFLFFLIGVVMEITLALASLPDGENENEAEKKVKPKPAAPEKHPPMKEVMAYIDAAIQKDHTLLSDEDAAKRLSNKIDKRRCAECRKFISSFIYKDSPVVDVQDGRYVARFDKENTKRFIELQYLVQRKKVLR